MRIISRYIARFLIAFLALTVVTLTALSFLPPPILRQLVLWSQALASPPEATPPPPTIIAPRGEMPTAKVGLTEWAQFEGSSFEPRGSGFLLRLSNGEVIGVTTAHSVGDLRQPDNTLAQLALGEPDQPAFVIQGDTLYGEPGLPRAGDDLTVDWLLLKVEPAQPIDRSLILTPDPRGGPQPGERVKLYSGSGARDAFGGVVQSVDVNGIWALMDDAFDAGGMSGSPLLSQHTGQVVGMAVAVDYSRSRVRIGFHPIGSIVEKAEAAVKFPRIHEYP
jgi:hypothetical protein